MNHPRKGGSYLRLPDGTLVEEQHLRPAPAAAPVETPAADVAPANKPADAKPARKAKTEK